jgi:LysR family transcriptional regulator, transcriptional activator of the cysJI operon
MDYRDIVFLAVAEKLSFSKAAEDLHISQPAVTKHIKELENHHKLNLFDRKGNRIYLTPAGKLTYNSLQKIAQLYRDLDFEIGQLNNSASGEIVIGASSTISQYVIPRVIASFHKKYPKIQIKLVNGNSFEIEQLLLLNKIDIALVENESIQTEIKYKDFLSDEIIVVTGSKSVYSKRKIISVEDLVQFPIVLREHGSGTLEVIKKAFQKRNIDIEKLNTLIHLGSTESIKNFLQDFDGIAIISEKATTTEIYLNNLIRLNVSGFTIPRKFRIALRQGFISRQVEMFESFLFAYNF